MRMRMEPVPTFPRLHLPPRLGRHLLAFGVLTFMAATTIVAALVLRSVVTSQERRLLTERAAELSAYLSASNQQTAAQLTAVGEAAVSSGAPDRLFHSLATGL